MSAKELGRVAVVGRVVAGALSLGTAATLLGISYRQMKRVVRRFRRAGAKGLRHGNAGRPSNHARTRRERARILALVRHKYGGAVGERFGPTLAAEHLASEDGIAIHHDTLRRWMVAEGLWSRTRKRAPYRQRRERRAHAGELVQLDGSFHAWFGDRSVPQCLITLVDDATSQSIGWFSAQETIWAAVAVLRTWIAQYGIPHALYTDWKNVYVRVPNADERLTGAAPLTQFGRMCATLGIRIIPASSPQAKGRIERNHGTHQDRLVKKLRRAAIAEVETANRFLETIYWPDHNRRFARPATSAEDFHRPRPTARQLDAIFRLEDTRVVGADWVVRYHNRALQLERQSSQAPARSTVVVSEDAAGTIEIRYRGRLMRWTELVPAAVPSPSLTAPPPAPPPRAPLPRAGVRPRWHPGREHPWRKDIGAPTRPIWQAMDQ